MTGKKKTAAWAVLVAGSLAMFLYSFTLPNFMLKIITMLSLIVSLSALIIEIHEKNGGEAKGYTIVWLVSVVFLIIVIALFFTGNLG